MKTIWFYTYNWLFIPLFWLILRFTSLFNNKVRHGIRSRRNLLQDISKKSKSLNAVQRIWFHSSSMGEFEQAKPIIALLKRRFKNIDIIVSFFSPSGYEHSKHYKLADFITYIPFDTKKNARLFIEKIKPTAAIFVRYDVWPNHLWELESRNIPILIANATMRKSSARFLPVIKNFHKYLFSNFSSILTVSDNDVKAFKNFGLDNVHIEAIGDTRYDQVWQRSSEAKQTHLLSQKIIRDKKIFVAGSTWPEDEEVIFPAIKKLLQYQQNLLVIIVPHEPNIESLENIEAQFNGKFSYIRFSALNDYNGERVIIIDSVGILMPLYQYADVAYVGGSFRQGVHNVIEPAVYGIPVIFGPKHTNSQEAVQFVKTGCGFVINNYLQCYKILRRLLHDKKANHLAGEKALDLIKKNIGATKRFISHLQKVISLRPSN